jgi:hypothetical protein
MGGIPRAVRDLTQNCVGTAGRILARPLTLALSPNPSPAISDIFRRGEGTKQARGAGERFLLRRRYYRCNYAQSLRFERATQTRAIALSFGTCRSEVDRRDGVFRLFQRALP